MSDITGKEDAQMLHPIKNLMVKVSSIHANRIYRKFGNKLAKQRLFGGTELEVSYSYDDRGFLTLSARQSYEESWATVCTHYCEKCSQMVAELVKARIGWLEPIDCSQDYSW